MKYRVSLAVNAWLEEEVEADSHRHATHQMMGRVGNVNARLREAGIDWLTVAELDNGDAIATDERGDELVFVADYDQLRADNGGGEP